MVAFSEKFLAVHSAEPMLVYPSLFDSIEGDSSNSGYSSKHEMSTTNDTYDDSAWTLKRKRKCDAMSDESLFHSSLRTIQVILGTPAFTRFQPPMKLRHSNIKGKLMQCVVNLTSMIH